MKALTQDWSERVCLITGGAGFIGAHLCEYLLAQGARVCVLDCQRPRRSYFIAQGLHDRVEFVFGDMRDLNALRWLIEKHEINTIFHLAAQASLPMSRVLPYETLSVNTVGTYTALEAARQSRHVEAFVFVSSGAVYGETSADAALNEDAALAVSSNIYASALVASEAAVQAYALTYQLNAAICRVANTFGPGDLNFSRLVPCAVRNLMMDAPYHFGDRDDGRTRLDFAFVKDIVRGCVQTAEWLHAQNGHAAGEAFNLGSGYPISTRTLTRIISRNFDGTERHPSFDGPAQRVPLIRYFNVNKAADLLGWRAETELEQGLNATIDWYRQRWQSVA